CPPLATCCVCQALPAPGPAPLPLHDALPIYQRSPAGPLPPPHQWELEQPPGSVPPRPPHQQPRWSTRAAAGPARYAPWVPAAPRSEEHTSELQSRENLVCRLPLEKKKHTTPD